MLSLASHRTVPRCPPCREFTPKLVAVYDALKKDAAAPPFEVVFVSSDDDAAKQSECVRRAARAVFPCAGQNASTASPTGPPGR